MTSIVGELHRRVAYDRRIERLATLIAERLPPACRVLDVGCGDGRLAARILSLRPDVMIEGVDVLARPSTAIPVQLFDGVSIPRQDRSVDVVMLVDVLHHAAQPERLLGDCARVARVSVLLKDHVREGFLAELTLKLMDWVGNARHGVALPYHYFTRPEWRDILAATGLSVTEWVSRLGLYAAPIDWLFGRGLHMIATLSPNQLPGRTTT